jgi:ribosomal protein L1
MFGAFSHSLDPLQASRQKRSTRVSKPSGAKDIYIKRISLSSTMGPGVKADLASAGA